MEMDTIRCALITSTQLIAKWITCNILWTMHAHDCRTAVGKVVTVGPFHHRQEPVQTAADRETIVLWLDPFG